MSTQVNKLIFFDKDGYPYNLTFDEENNEWYGKIYFDNNGDDTFKTVCMYIFEKVPGYKFSDTFDVRSSQLFNYSGMTFVPSTYTGETITNIQKVNSSTNHYSKWIYGDNFDKKFPVGTVVNFVGVTGSTSISLNDSGITYNVLGNKKGAFLIDSNENNGSSFIFIFSGGTVSSLNIIKSPDYGNQLIDLNYLNYYKNKKLSVSGSVNNDGIYTYFNYDKLKMKIYDFNLSVETGGTLTLGFYLMTQRPELYEGNVLITYNSTDINDIKGTTIKFYNYINTNIDFTTTGQTIIFENADGSHIHTDDPIFTITGFINREEIITDQLKFFTNESVNIIQSLSGITGLIPNDQIELTSIDGGTYSFHDKRQFQVLNVTDNNIQIREYIIPESGCTYRIDKIIKKNKVQEIYCKRTAVDTIGTFTGYTTCYSTSNYINLTQDVLNSGNTTYYYENTVSSMKNKYKTLLDRYGLNLYHYHYMGNNYLIFEGLDYNYKPYYSGATAHINSTLLNVDNKFSGNSYIDSDIYYFNVNEKFSKYEKFNIYDQLARNFYVEIYFDIVRDSTSYGFNMNLNNIDYYIDLSGNTTYTQETINAFVDKYGSALDGNGITILSGYTYDGYTGYTLIIESQQPNINLYNIDVKVNSYSDYSFINRILNQNVVVASDELFLVDTNNTLFDYGLSTGMVINVSGFTHTINNKQFNILRVTEDTIQLSYQGAFLEEENVFLNININEFIRYPRGTYDKDIYYKFSWEPIQENSPQITDDIFFYDYSGDQLGDKGGLTYLGEKPLWNSNTKNLVFLNKEPNNNVNRIYDPEYQQTVFSEITHTLERLNSSTNYNYLAYPMQIFIGFNSKTEGVSNNNMKIERIENIIFSGTTDASNNFLISGSTYYSDIYYNTNDSCFDFNLLGFEVNQHISLNFLENTITGHTLFGNYSTYTIIDVTRTKITVNENLEYFDSSSSGKTYDFTMKTEPDTIAVVQFYGQTEIEDERFNQNLKLVGAKLESDVQHIFKESDVNEVGIDYVILNRKRKELLSVYNDIYNFIGSYKALINSINYFGYNDLELYEYYKCIKPSSPLFGKLQRVHVEDIFINTIPGWKEIEIDDVNYFKTNLFNLTYNITDFDGNCVLMYSLDEVQNKLNKLVHWLRDNVVPLSANILDVTGVAQTTSTMYLNYDGSNYVKKINVNQDCVVINFDYIETLNIDTNYLFTVNFYLTSGTTMPKYWTCKIRTFHLNETTQELEPVQYHQLYKYDLLSYSFNVDKNIDPYMYIETQSFNDYGLGYTNNRFFNFNEGRNFILVNNNFNGVNYKYLTDLKEKKYTREDAW